MKVMIQVIAIDEDNRLKASEQKTIDVPASFLRLNEALFGSGSKETVRAIRDTVMAAAMQSVQDSKSSRASGVVGSLKGDGSGKIGQDAALYEMLGGDIVENIVARETGRPRPQRQQQQPTQQRAHGVPLPPGPGSGFMPDTSLMPGPSAPAPRHGPPGGGFPRPGQLGYK